MKRLSFQKRLFLYYFAVFAIFLIIVLIYQYSREKDAHTKQLNNSLQNVVEMTHLFIDKNNLLLNNNFGALDTFKNYVPEANSRITVIDINGKVLYDSSVKNYVTLENHLRRPEIQKALYSNIGTSIRKSETTEIDYYYYAHFYSKYFIRVAKVYDIQIQDFLKTERLPILFILICFSIIWALLFFVTHKISDSINKLKDFAIHIRSGNNQDEPVEFRNNDELGIIGSEIVDIYDNMTIAKNDLALQKEKLFSHLNLLNEGIAFFDSNKKATLTNGHFIHFFNIISKKRSLSTSSFFDTPVFDPILAFVNTMLSNERDFLPTELPTKEFLFNENGKYFRVLCTIFNDRSFEILISDITKAEKTKRFKHQLTSNIAQELRTPVLSIKEYLETIRYNPDLSATEKSSIFDKTTVQLDHLIARISDIVNLNKIEEGEDQFILSEVNIREVIADVIENYQIALKIKSMNTKVFFDDPLFVIGNFNLLFSVFQNLLENSINYAGEKTTVTIKIAHEDDHFIYFSFSDNGISIPNEHLPKLFDRFYRVDLNENEKISGAGLGLSIVKNAITLQNGEISVRNLERGGVEFLFSLPK